MSPLRAVSAWWHLVSVAESPSRRAEKQSAAVSSEGRRGVPQAAGSLASTGLWHSTTISGSFASAITPGAMLRAAPRLSASESQLPDGV